MNQPNETRISMPEYTGPPCTRIDVSSYESWLRSEGAFELANELSAGDRPAKGTETERLSEFLGLPWYRANIEHAFRTSTPLKTIKLEFHY